MNHFAAIAGLSLAATVAAVIVPSVSVNTTPSSTQNVSSAQRDQEALGLSQGSDDAPSESISPIAQPAVIQQPQATLQSQTTVIPRRGNLILRGPSKGAAAKQQAASETPIAYAGPAIAPTQIIAWNDSVARFDRTNGAIHRFRGSLENPSSKGQWELLVRPVNGSSGLMEIQRPEGVNIRRDTAFLVDMVTGDTWILRRRSTFASWEPVRILR